MKLNTTQLINVSNVLKKYAEKKLPIELSYKFMKFSTAIEPELRFFQEKINNLIQDCAERDKEGDIVYTDNGDNIQLKKDKLDEFNTQYKEIIEMEVEIGDFEFALKELDSLEISPKDLFALSPFIKE